MSDAHDRLSSALADRYRIERELGQGGMATVYLAEDLKHDRKVALKVLKPELAAVLGADRFVVEIKTTAALQHPHILPLFDSGEAGGFLYYVMPYVEGETLREKLNRETQLAVDEAVRITTEVADALDYAHRHGVVHRDIKPENILLHDGRPVVADFGIALALSAAAGGRMTETGMSLGTPHYMSPEQATADKDITSRADIYSLAAVLYEMLTGEPPHMGNSAQAIIMKIVTEDVAPVTKLRKSVPPNVAAAVGKALEKVPADRFGSAKEFSEALATPGYRTEAAAAAGVPAALQPSRLVVLLGAVAVLAVALAAWGWLRPRPAPQPRRQEIVLGHNAFTPPGVVGAGMALAPDGSAIVYPDTSGGGRLMIKEQDDLDGRGLIPISDAPYPSFSPDGQWIAFVDGRLEKVSRSGGAAVRVSDSSATSGTAWLDDGTILFIGQGGARLYATGASGGPARRILTSDAVGGAMLRVNPVPGTEAGLVTVDGLTPVVIGVDLATGSVDTVVTGALAAWVLPGPTLLYATVGGDLLAARFNPEKLTITGTPVSVLNGIRSTTFEADAAVAADGTLLYAAGPSDASTGRVQVMSVARNGLAVPLDSAFSFLTPGNGGLRLSPDGMRLALNLVDSATGNSNIYVLRLATGVASRLTFEGTTNIRPVWSPDGGTILYTSNVSGKHQLQARKADGSGRPLDVQSEPRGIWEGLWSSDSSWLVYRTDDAAAGNGDIYARQDRGDTTAVPLLETVASETSPALSPNGRWLAYAATSGQSQQKQIYVRPFPAVGDGIWLVSTEGGTEPVWSHDGKSLFYRRSSDRMMMAAEVAEDPTFTVLRRTPLFSAAEYLSNSAHRYYDVTPDDRRFIMLRRVPEKADQGEAGRFVLVEHWLQGVQEQLRR